MSMPAVQKFSKKLCGHARSCTWCPQADFFPHHHDVGKHQRRRLQGAGIITFRGPSDALQVCLVQNQKNIVSFPKGARQNSVLDVATSLREWAEETNYNEYCLDIDYTHVFLDGHGDHYFLTSFLGAQNQPEEWVPTTEDTHNPHPIVMAWWTPVAQVMAQ